MSKDVFLICPVRGVDPKETEGYVKHLEGNGVTVHWPPRDTDQNDDSGFWVCFDNRDAMRVADVVHFIWDGKSEGCLFDLGMAFAMGKKVCGIKMPQKTEGKSFQNMVREWERETW